MAKLTSDLLTPEFQDYLNTQIEIAFDPFAENKTIPEWIEPLLVTDCNTVEEFAHKYRKAERFTLQGDEYVECILKHHYEDIQLFGYTTISHHDCNTGKHIAFIPKNS